MYYVLSMYNVTPPAEISFRTISVFIFCLPVPSFKAAHAWDRAWHVSNQCSKTWTPLPSSAAHSHTSKKHTHFSLKTIKIRLVHLLFSTIPEELETDSFLGEIKCRRGVSPAVASCKQLTTEEGHWREMPKKERKISAAISETPVLLFFFLRF